MVETSSSIGLRLGNYNNATNVKGVLNILTIGYSERLHFSAFRLQPRRIAQNGDSYP